MIDLNLVEGKSVSLLIWNTEKENDVQICLGEIIHKNDDFYFINKAEDYNVTLTPEMLARLREVPSELKQTLRNSDFSISLSLGNLPGELNSDYKSTGIKWND